jgi:hypothetical protein
MVGMVIDGLQRYFVERAGLSTSKELNGYGDVRGLKSRKSNQSVVGFGSMTDLA